MESRYFATAACALAITLGTSAVARADVLVDRGLPTANINAGDITRSNVAWTDGGMNRADYLVEGDTFKNSGSGTWFVNTIRIWTVGSFDVGSLSLLGQSTSAPASSLGTISSSYSVTPTTYANGANYISGSGASLALTEVDFAVNLQIAAGEQFVFFLNGTGGRYTVPFMSASNAAFSGSPQDQADGLLWQAELVNGVPTSITNFSTLNNGWDKASDFNVQVIGTAVPEPGSVVLLGIGLFGAVFAQRRRS